VKNWPWSIILTIFACLLIVIGIVPRANQFMWRRVHNLQPLRMPLPLKKGEYTSQFFKTDLKDTYKIDFSSDDDPTNLARIDLDWKIVDDRGFIIKQGTYSNPIDNGFDAIGEYRPKLGTRQRIIVRIQNVIPEKVGAHTELLIGLPQRINDFFNIRDMFNAWACITSGPGALLLLFLLIRRMRQPKQQAI